MCASVLFFAMNALYKAFDMERRKWKPKQKDLYTYCHLEDWKLPLLQQSRVPLQVHRKLNQS